MICQGHRLALESVIGINGKILIHQFIIRYFSMFCILHGYTVKKVVISTYTFLPDIGGVATCTSTLVSALVQLGCNVTVVTNTKSDKSYGKKNSYTIIRNPNLIELFRIYFSADIILLSNLSFKLGWPTIFLKGNIGLMHHSSSAFQNRNDSSLINSIKELFKKCIIKKAVHFVNSRFTMADGKAFFDGLRVVVAYPIAEPSSISKTIHQNFYNKRNAYFAGRLVKEKGVDFIIDNANQIKEILGVEKIYIAGDGVEKRQLEEKVKKYNVTGVVFLGRTSQKRVTIGMDNAAYVLVPSFWEEPFGIVAVEGLTSGAVVITSNRGGLPEAVGGLGILFDIESEVGFKEALMLAKERHDKMLSSKNYLNDYIEKTNKHLDKFSANTIGNIILRTFD